MILQTALGSRLASSEIVSAAGVAMSEFTAIRKEPPYVYIYIYIYVYIYIHIDIQPDRDPLLASSEIVSAAGWLGLKPGLAHGRSRITKLGKPPKSVFDRLGLF